MAIRSRWEKSSWAIGQGRLSRGEGLASISYQRLQRDRVQGKPALFGP
jgi:hypothetical protein